MLESTSFTFDGISSKDMGVRLVSIGGGLYKESFLPTRKITEQKIIGNPIPFFQNVETESLSFNISIVLEDWAVRNQARAVARWLYQDYYKPLTFDSNPDLIIYAMFTGKSELNHNGVNDGYITLNIQSKSPYMYSSVHEVEINSNSNATLNIYNNGDLPMYLNLEIFNKLNGDFSIKNMETSEEFKINNLFTNEEVYVDFKHEYVISSLEERLRRYLGDNTNDGWFTIPPESTVELLITGNVIVKVKYQYEYLMFDKELGR